MQTLRIITAVCFFSAIAAGIGRNISGTSRERPKAAEHRLLLRRRLALGLPRRRAERAGRQGPLSLARNAANGQSRARRYPLSQFVCREFALLAGARLRDDKPVQPSQRHDRKQPAVVADDSDRWTSAPAGRLHHRLLRQVSHGQSAPAARVRLRRQLHRPGSIQQLPDHLQRRRDQNARLDRRRLDRLRDQVPRTAERRQAILSLARLQEPTRSPRR